MYYATEFICMGIFTVYINRMLLFYLQLEIKILGDSKLRKVCKGKGDDKKCKRDTR